MSLGSNISDQLRHGADALDPKHLASAAREQGTHAAQVAVDAGMDVARKVGEQASAVAEQAKEQLAAAMGHAKDEISTQVERRGKKAARSARSLLHVAERQVHRYAPGRKRSSPHAAVATVMAFARRRPVTFLLIVAAVGFGATRLIRAVAAPTDNSSRGAKAGAGSGDAARTDRDSSGNDSADFADSSGPLTTETVSNEIA